MLEGLELGLRSHVLSEVHVQCIRLVQADLEESHATLQTHVSTAWGAVGAFGDAVCSTGGLVVCWGAWLVPIKVV